MSKQDGSIAVELCETPERCCKWIKSFGVQRSCGHACADGPAESYLGTTGNLVITPSWCPLKEGQLKEGQLRIPSDEEIQVATVGSNWYLSDGSRHFYKHGWIDAVKAILKRVISLNGSLRLKSLIDELQVIAESSD